MRRVLLHFLIFSVILACQQRKADVSEPLATAPSDDAGYFVAVSAQPLFDGLHDAIDKLNRKRLAARGELEAYIEAYDADGYTRLAAGDDEIECDREKCLVKLTGRALTGSATDDESMASLMTEAMALKGVKPEIRGTGDAQLKTYVLGKASDSFVRCTQKGFGRGAAYRCEFALDRGAGTPANASIESSGHGKLVSCALSPGTVRTADEARREVDGGALLSLTSGSGAGAKSVGYLRYVRQGRQVEFLDLFLCGDVSHDYFHIEGKAKDPRGWVPPRFKVGTEVPALESLTQDDARMQASAKIVEESPRLVTLEVRFKLDREAAAGDDVYGDDAFFMKLDKAWIE